MAMNDKQQFNQECFGESIQNQNVLYDTMQKR